jgi:putative endonuclease
MINHPVFVMYYVYVIYSESADKYYIGYTDNMEMRLRRHNNATFNSFTHKYRPWIVKACFEAGPDKKLAMKMERYIKKQKSRNFLEDLVANKDNPAHFVQLVRVPTCRD